VWGDFGEGRVFDSGVIAGEICEHYQAGQWAAEAAVGVIFESGKPDGAEFVADQNLCSGQCELRKEVSAAAICLSIILKAAK
jgi:hypothetical protein